MSLSIGLVNLGLVFHARETLGFSPTLVGGLPATHALAYVTGCLFLSPRLSHLYPRLWVAVSLVCLSVCFLVLSWIRSYGSLLIVCFCYGISLSLLWPFLMGWLSEGREGTRLGRAMSRYNFSWSSAAVFGPYLCGWLSEVDTRIPLWSGALLGLATLVMMVGAPPSSPAGTPFPSRLETGAYPEEQHVRARWLRIPGWVGLAVSFLGVGVFSAAFPVGAREELGLPLRTVGLLLLVRAFFSTGTFVVLGFTHRWHFRVGPMLWGQAAGALAFVGLAMTSHSAGLAVLLALTGISASFSYSVSMFHGVSGAARRPKRMAIHEAMLSTGLVVGSLGGAAVYDAAGLPAVYLVTACFLLCSVGLQALLFIGARVRGS